MLEISTDGRQLLTILAKNLDGNSRWTEADFAQIYGQDTPNIDESINELLDANLIKVTENPLGRRKTDQYEITEAGIALINSPA